MMMAADHRPISCKNPAPPLPPPPTPTAATTYFLCIYHRNNRRWDGPYSDPELAAKEASTYLETWHGLSAEGELERMEELALPYLPFFSNCREFDSFIPFYHLVEDEFACAEGMEFPGDEDDETGLSAVYDSYFPTPDEVYPTDPFAWYNSARGDFINGLTLTRRNGEPWDHPVADQCYRTVQCAYEEDLEGEISSRWFSAENEEELFSIIATPVMIHVLCTCTCICGGA